MRVRLFITSGMLCLYCSLMFGQSEFASAQEDVGHRKSQNDFRRNLINKKWILAEFKRIKQDTITNLIVLLQDCEKDNFTQYYGDGTYTIFEGESRCDAVGDDKKGVGNWDFEEERNVILDEYQGGREIEKKVVELTETTLKLEFESEGGTRSMLTFYTPEALETEEVKEKISSPSDYQTMLTKIIRESLIEKDRYIILKKSEFLGGELPELSEQQRKHKKVIVLYPIENATEGAIAQQEFELDNSTLQQAQEFGVDFLLTGKIIKAQAVQNKGRFNSEFKFDLRILDLASGNEKYREEIKGIYPNRVGRITRGVLRTAGNVAMALIGYDYAGAYGAAYMLDSKQEITNDYNQILNKNAGSRLAKLQETEAIISALENTVKDVGNFIDNNLPLLISIKEVSARTKKGEIKSLKINCGSSCRLSNNEKLKVVLLDQGIENGNPVNKISKTIGTISIESIDSTGISTCKIIKGRKELTQHLEAGTTNLFAVTKAKSSIF